METATRGRPADYEEPYYWRVGGGFYTGKYPAWWDIEDHPAKRLLEDNFETIKAEILEYYGADPASFQPNWLPYGYTNPGWLTLDLKSYGLLSPKNIERFPKLYEIVNRLPGVMLAQVAVLQPKTKIRTHIGETQAIVRFHLPIIVPGAAPDLGIRVGAETRCWEEGKVFALNIAYRHRAWNLTEFPRIVVVVDYVHPDFADRQHEIEANGLALMGLKGLAYGIPILRHSPPQLNWIFQRALAWPIRGILWLQRRYNTSLPNALFKKRPEGRKYRPIQNDSAVSINPAD